MSDNDVHWQRASHSSLISHSYADQSVVYHCGSGDTHVIDLIGMTLLKLLESPQLESRLIELLADQLNYQLDQEFIDHLQESLQVLNKIELIEQAE